MYFSHCSILLDFAQVQRSQKQHWNVGVYPFDLPKAKAEQEK